MYYAYGPLMDLRVLDELNFWKQQESEHTVVIEQMVPNLETEFTAALKKWGVMFADLQALTERYSETLIRHGGLASARMRDHILHLVRVALEQSQQFIRFLQHLQTVSKPVKENPVINVILNHIRRESEYFIGILQILVHPEPALFHPCFPHSTPN